MPWSSWGSPTGRTTSPRSCREGSSSGSPSPGRSPRTRRSFCATSRRAPSIPSRGSSCSRRWSASTGSWGPPPPSSPITRTSPGWRTGSCTCAPDGSRRSSGTSGVNLPGSSIGEPMRMLDRKMLRDLVGLKGQAIAIAMVIVSGVATFVMSVSTLDSLRRTQEIYYRDYRFADVFASLKRAPEALRSRILEIPGEDAVETRVVAAASLDIPDFPDPVRAQLVSVPEEGAPRLNGVFLRKGRMVDPRRDGEVVVNEPFAEAHGFAPG